MTRETKRLFVLGRSPEPDRTAPEEEAIELKRRSQGKRAGGPAASKVDSGQAEETLLAREIADDDDTVALPLAVRAPLLPDDAPTAALEKGPRGVAGLAPGADRGRRKGPTTERTVVSKGRRVGIGGTMLMAPEDHPPAEAGADEPDAVVSAARPGRAGGDGSRRCPACGLTFSSPDVQFCPFDGDRLESAPTWDPSADPLLGKTIAERYEVQAVLAEGSMGTVYRVRHARLGTQFALKVLRRDLAREKDLAARLVDEARATAAIGHPNIVAVTDFGEVGVDLVPDLGDLRLPYFVMELLGGESLSDALARGGPMSAGRVASIAHQCAQALAAAHAAGIVHRDLKPGNIRLVSSRRGDVVKILDFGVAKILGSSRRTKVGTVFGTPHYMSPEQGRGHEIDHRTDIYSLGVIMYQCLTGRVPFEADTYMGVVTKHLFARPEPIRASDASETAEHRIEPVVMRCLEKDAANRYPVMDDLAHDLEAVLAGEPSGAERDLRGGSRLRLREQERVLAPARPEALEPLPLARSSTPWFLGGIAIVIVVGLAWWRPWQRAAEPTSADGGALTVTAAAPPVTPAGSSLPIDVVATATESAATAPPSTDASATAAVGRRRPPPSDGAAAASIASATPTASADTAPTAPPPRPKSTGTRHGGDVVDPWGH